MSPPEAERVACGVGIHPVPLGGGQIVGCLQQASTELECLGVGACGVIDVQIEMDLLRISVRPYRWDMVGSELNADHPAPVCVEDAGGGRPRGADGRRSSAPTQRREVPLQLQVATCDSDEHSIHSATASHPQLNGSPTITATVRRRG